MMNKKFDFKNIAIVILGIVIIIEAFIIGTQMKPKKDVGSRNDVFIQAQTIEDINALKQENKPLIVVFGADYCPTCINYKPYIKEMAELYGDQVDIKYVDTVDCEDIRDDYNIEFIPSTLFFDKDGNPYAPSKNLEVVRSDEKTDDRQYISSEYVIAEDGYFDYNDQFEYGLDKNNNHAYTKFVGLLDMLQLEEIIIELIR